MMQQLCRLIAALNSCPYDRLRRLCAGHASAWPRFMSDRYSYSCAWLPPKPVGGGVWQLIFILMEFTNDDVNARSTLRKTNPPSPKPFHGAHQQLRRHADPVR